jgi:hypothetical protein
MVTPPEATCPECEVRGSRCAYAEAEEEEEESSIVPFADMYGGNDILDE